MTRPPYKPQSAFARWMDKRLPLARFVHDAIFNFSVPRNLNYFYTFGGILTLMLLSQIITGLVMAMHYVPEVTLAFASRERFMRDGQFGWLFAPWHAVGASFFFIAAYIHIARGLYYGSHKNPREVVWIIGVLIYIVMMATAFFGYVLVWSVMSSAGAAVIASFFKTLPLIGDGLHQLMLGGYGVGQPTLNRFYVFHYLFSFILVGLVILHIWSVHQVGQNNPTGVEMDESKDESLPFAPYALVKDIFSITVFLIFFAWALFYMPDYLHHPDNFMPANATNATSHIVPEWYFLPFYAMLRAMTFDIGPMEANLNGVMVLMAAIAILLFVPWLDRSPIRSSRYRPLYRCFYWLWIGDVVWLGWLATLPVDDHTNFMAQIGTGYYFTFFLIIMPFLPRFERVREPPSITQERTQKRRGCPLWW